MMASTAWDGQDQHMTTGDDEFNQFLDMSNMGNMGDSIQFDFHGFPDGSSQALMAQQQQQHQQQHQQQQQQQRQHQADSIMGDANQAASVMVTSAGMPTTQLLATSAPDNTISTIDAQIQYLQQQKYQHQQQRQIQEQRATFYGNHGHSVPPTPQSLEMQPGSGQFYSQEQGQRRGYHQQRMSEQQDVSVFWMEFEGTISAHM